jgi:hypothetical protein
MAHRRSRGLILSFLIAAGTWFGAAQAADSHSDPAAVFVNGRPLAADTVIALQQTYRTRIPSGHYWYDRVSGAWGFEDGPAQGQIQPGLVLGGPLRADASRGDTGVFVNGRELHRLDVVALQRCVIVIPGRYWVDARGVGGYEGGPARFDLAQLCGAAQRRAGGSTQTECYSNGCQSTNSRTGIGVITDGQGHGAVFVPGSGMVMTPN